MAKYTVQMPDGSTPRSLGGAYCARTVSQKRTPKVEVRRKAWGYKGQKSVG